MNSRAIYNYTEAEFLEFVKKICRAEGATEEEDESPRII
ncbi:TPA: bacteriocin immunity protein [Klebsiella pneumoniae]|nr:bacteriocin immunity protein [Klebsiella pneumoniae]HBX3663108.1 hypothetical protein [Klebsiella pneumoniae subsp. pneumoniae]EJO2888212.1 bacteriocin immunity protein [Klebsiella pneumoniae]MBC4207001.1 bacteriocin immunity protein [Klebsiella pneumoniae]MCE7516329.1 bacteriocin immunity protein [Klebsiella pneumoniae]MCH9572071.1 bacteriocin immunity protein [Klebsiella pneumoniae]